MNTKLDIEPWTKLMQVRNLEMKLHQLPRKSFYGGYNFNSWKQRHTT